MIIQLASDLHTEMHQDRGEAITKELAKASKTSQVKVLVLAGDITSSTNFDTLETILKRFCDAYEHVVKVVGNHFFYNSSVYRKENQIMRLNNSISNLHILDNTSVTIEGQRFLGATGWFPKDLTTTQFQMNCMADFVYIENFTPWCYNKNKVFRKLMAKELNDQDCVVTHHLPSYLAVAPQFKNDQLNRFFVNPMDDLIKERQPKAWLYGHSHICMDFNIGKTRLVNNAFGYPREDKSKFNPNLIIEI